MKRWRTDTLCRRSGTDRFLRPGGCAWARHFRVRFERFEWLAAPFWIVESLQTRPSASRRAAGASHAQVYARQPFQQLSASFAQLPLTVRAASRDVGGASPEGAVDFAPLRLGPRQNGKSAKTKGLISQSETKRFATGSQALEIIGGREIGHFAGLFVFNDLTPFSFRPNRERRVPRPTKPPSGAGESASPASAYILKNSSQSREVCQQNVGLSAERPPLDRGRLAAVGNGPSQPISRIPCHCE
jgi:hypothetical protein